MDTRYKDYLLQPRQVKEKSGKWTVSIKITKERAGSINRKQFNGSKTGEFQDEQQAEAASILLGKSLVDKKLVGF